MNHSSENPCWYDRQYGDALDFGERHAERKWHPDGLRSFSAAAFLASRGDTDTNAAGQWTAAWFDCLLEEREASIIPHRRPQTIAACWNEIVAAQRVTNAAPVRSGPVRLALIARSDFRPSNGEHMADQSDDAVTSVLRAARPQWHVGQLWQERKPFRNGLVRIEAITDHPETPIIGRCTRTGLVDCYGLNGAWESDGMFRQVGEVSDGDLVTLIEDVCPSAGVRRVG